VKNTVISPKTKISPKLIWRMDVASRPNELKKFWR
jgi:hypothetical protein